MNPDLVSMALLFLSGALVLATKLLPVSPELMPWLIYGSAVIDLALGIFYGRSGIRKFRASRAAK
jgi:hypothetical protein